MKIITGNIIEVTHGTILHQVNCRGAVGGLAGALHAKWPGAFEEYFAACRVSGLLMAGETLVTDATASLRIAHVFGQREPGADTSMSLARAALRHATRNVHREPVYAPFRMGCGIGGGNWDEYLAALCEAFPEVIIVQRPEDAR